MSKVWTYCKKAWRARKRLFNSRDMLQYLVFVAIAGAFWCFMTFNQQTQQDVAVRVVVKGKPQGITFIDDLPSTITVTVKDRGTTFLKFLFRRQPKVTLDFDTFSDDKSDSFDVSELALQALVKRLFRREATIVRISPESLHCRFTDRPAKRVPVNYFENLHVTPNSSSVFYGDIECTPDSVLVYADAATLAHINEVKIMSLRADNIDQLFEKEVRLEVPDGAKVVPARVKLTIPVEPLIQRRQAVPVQVRNVPEGVHVIVFPGSVEATFLLPQSLYKKPINSFVAVVDYNSIVPTSNKVAVTVGEVPAVFEGIKLATDSVEYIIER